MKNHIPLIVGIALPIIFIIIISVLLFVPPSLVNPEHDFVYTMSDRYEYNYCYRNYYELKNNKIVLKSTNLNLDEKKIDPNIYESIKIEDMPDLYIYHVKTDTTNEISFEEAQKLTLLPGPSSPDGYTVSYQYNHDGIFELFGSNPDSQGYFISKGNKSKRLANLGDTNYYSGNFDLIGWVQ